MAYELPPDLMKLLRKLERPERALKAVSASLAEESINLIKDGFRTETDPYGQRWAKRKRETPQTIGRLVLSGETGRLKTGYKATNISEQGFLVTASVEYAMHHQMPKPDSGRVARMQVPDADRGLSNTWASQFDEAAQDVLEDYFKP